MSDVRGQIMQLCHGPEHLILQVLVRRYERAAAELQS